MDSSPKISSILRGFIVFLLILAAGLSLQLFSTGILNIIDFYRPDLMASYKSMVSSSFSLDNGLLRVLTVMFIAPVAEELIFRGISLQSFQRAFTFKCTQKQLQYLLQLCCLAYSTAISSSSVMLFRQVFC